MIFCGSPAVMALALVLVAWAPQVPASPAAVDCKQAAAKSVAAAICASPTLTSLHQEMDRLDRLARSPDASSIGAVIDKDRRAWSVGREACMLQPTPETCLREQYLEGIAMLRSASKEARAADGKGISHGPAAFHCGAANEVWMATFVNAGPGLVWIARKDRGYVLEQARSASGARYEGGGRLFWEHQGEAVWRERPDAAEVKCRKAAQR